MSIVQKLWDGIIHANRHAGATYANVSKSGPRHGRDSISAELDEITS